MDPFIYIPLPDQAVPGIPSLPPAGDREAGSRLVPPLTRDHCPGLCSPRSTLVTSLASAASPSSPASTSLGETSTRTGCSSCWRLWVRARGRCRRWESRRKSRNKRMSCRTTTTRVRPVRCRRAGPEGSGSAHYSLQVTYASSHRTFSIICSLESIFTWAMPPRQLRSLGIRGCFFQSGLLEPVVEEEGRREVRRKGMFEMNIKHSRLMLHVLFCTGPSGAACPASPGAGTCSTDQPRVSRACQVEVIPWPGLRWFILLLCL